MVNKLLKKIKTVLNGKEEYFPDPLKECSKVKECVHVDGFLCDKDCLNDKKEDIKEDNDTVRVHIFNYNLSLAAMTNKGHVFYSEITDKGLYNKYMSYLINNPILSSLNMSFMTPYYLKKSASLDKSYVEFTLESTWLCADTDIVITNFIRWITKLSCQYKTIEFICYNNPYNLAFTTHGLLIKILEDNISLFDMRKAKMLNVRVSHDNLKSDKDNQYIMASSIYYLSILKNKTLIKLSDREEYYIL